jgi:hypothetical protein
VYEQSISRRRPGCIVFLVDRSDSMNRPWGGSGESLAAGAARAINGILMELCLRAQKAQGVTNHYFDVGIFGYGLRPVAGGEGVEPAFGGALAGRALVPIQDIRDNPVKILQYASPDLGGAQVQMPVWVEAMHGYRTPMCEAIAVAGQHVYDWAQQHPESFPPIVINITDGIVTDSPYSGASLADWAKRLTGIGTQDGPSLLFNVFLAPEPIGNVIFPPSAHGLPAPGPQLFEISSALPEPMIRNSGLVGIAAGPGSRGFAFNVGDTSTLVKILEIGTRVETRDY